MKSAIIHTKQSEISEVFKTDFGSIYQFDTKKCWYLSFAGKLVCFDYKSLIDLKKKVNQIDIEKMLLDSRKNADLEIIFICATSSCYVLDLIQIIHLKELIDGAFTMLELNHIIYDRLIRINQVY